MATVKRLPKASENHVAPSEGATTPASAALSIQAKFAAARRELAGALIERDAEIDVVLTALVAGENITQARDAAACATCDHCGSPQPVPEGTTLHRCRQCGHDFTIEWE